MGFLQRLFGKRREPEVLLARFPESVVAGTPRDGEAAARFPAIPADHLAVLVTFMHAGARETGSPLTDDQMRRAIDIVCAGYQSGGLEVRRAGGDWQVWQLPG
ncbi:MAG: hypothetical protein WD689_00605 [Gaiellaceae bacterium]